MTNTTVISHRKDIEDKIHAHLKAAMDKVGQLVERKATSNANNPRGGGKRPYVQSGLLSSNIGYHTDVSGDKVYTEVGFSDSIPDQDTVKYARIIEFGNSRQPPYPFLFPAVESSRKRIIEFLKDKKGFTGIRIQR